MMRTRQKLFTNKPRNVSDNCFLMYSKCLNQYITFWKWIIAFEVEYQLLEPKFSQCKSRWYCRNQCKGLFSHLVLRNMHDVTILKVSLIKHFFVYQKCWYFLLLRIFFQDSNKNLYILRRTCTDFINTLQSWQTYSPDLWQKSDKCCLLSFLVSKELLKNVKVHDLELKKWVFGSDGLMKHSTDF